MLLFTLSTNLVSLVIALSWFESLTMKYNFILGKEDEYVFNSNNEMELSTN